MSKSHEQEQVEAYNLSSSSLITDIGQDSTRKRELPGNNILRLIGRDCIQLWGLGREVQTPYSRPPGRAGWNSQALATGGASVHRENFLFFKEASALLSWPFN